MIQASINCIQKRLEPNNIEDVVKNFLSASCAEELAEPIRNLADYIPDIKLNQAFHESYELDHFPVDLHHLATNNEAPMMSYIASVLLVVTPDSMRVERLVRLYNDVKTIRRSELSEETERPSCNRVQVHWCSQLGSTTGSSQIPHRKNTE